MPASAPSAAPANPEDGSPAAPESAPAGSPAPAPLPPGTVALDKAEHDRLQAQARRATKLEREAKDREDRERAEAQRAAGDFDAALATERQGRERLESQLQERDVRDAVRDHIGSLGFSGSKATGLLRLVDVGAITVTDGAPDAADIEAAVAATVEQFPDLFNLEAASEPSTVETPMQQRRHPGPAVPDAQTGQPSDYLSPEEYQRTPHKVRMTQEFQERARRSRPHWPTQVPASTFGSGS